MPVRVVIKTDLGTFAKVTPGVIKQARQALIRETLKQIAFVERVQPGEEYVVRVDNKWADGKGRGSIQNAKGKIQAFWAFPANARVLQRIWQLIQQETYKYVARRTGTLGGSWLIFFKAPQPGGRPIKGKGRPEGVQVGANFPSEVAPGSGYTFLNKAEYGSLMSRYSAVKALRLSIAKAVTKTKDNQPLKLKRKLKKSFNTILYQNTPKGYSTVTRIAKLGRAFARNNPSTVRAFDLKEVKGSFSYLKRLSGINVTFFKGITRQDVIRDGRLT